MRERKQPAKASTPEIFGPGTWLLLMAGAALFALLSIYLPMIGQRWQPQGRYLFPALVPLLTLLVVGLRAWLPKSRSALAAWALFLFALDQTALWQVIYRAYHV